VTEAAWGGFEHDGWWIHQPGDSVRSTQFASAHESHHRQLQDSTSHGAVAHVGARLAGARLPEIDELLIKQYPVVAGAGVPLFAGPFDPTPFDPSDARPLASRAVVMTYTRQSG